MSSHSINAAAARSVARRTWRSAVRRSLAAVRQPADQRAQQRARRATAPRAPRSRAARPRAGRCERAGGWGRAAAIGMRVALSLRALGVVVARQEALLGPFDAACRSSRSRPLKTNAAFQALPLVEPSRRPLVGREQQRRRQPGKRDRDVYARARRAPSCSGAPLPALPRQAQPGEQRERPAAPGATRAASR